MKREPVIFSKCKFDVLVIGGGVYGAAIAMDAARIGFKTALIEKKDFGHATSANSLKILHGGLRYLQHLDFKRMRESVSARNDLMRLAPQLSKPLGCLMPLYGYGLKSREAFRIGLLLNDLISWDWNRDLGKPNRLPKGRLLSKSAAMDYIPGIDKRGLRGAALWFDALALNTERLILEMLYDAVANGACIMNYMAARDLIVDRGVVRGVKTEDRLSGDLCQIRSQMTINAAGPWSMSFFPSNSNRRDNGQLWAKAINIIVKKKIASEYAFGLEGRRAYTDKDAVFRKGKRLFFFVPWRKNYTMIGTSYRYCSPREGGLAVQATEIENMIDEINDVYPYANICFKEVTAIHRGLVPIFDVSETDEQEVQLHKNTQIIDHEKEDDMPGLMSVIGVKYTTSTQTAKKIVGMIGEKIGKHNSGPRGEGKDIIGVKGNRMFLSAEERVGETLPSHLRSLYGNKWRKVFEYIVPDAEEEPVIWGETMLHVGEINYYVDEEMAITLPDVVFRRSDIGSHECPPFDVLNRIAGVMGKKLGWDEYRREKEVQEVIHGFVPLLSVKNPC